MGFYAAYLLSWAAIGRSLGLGAVFLAGIAVAAAQAVWHYTLIRDRSREGCFRAFRENHWVGCAVFAGATELARRSPETPATLRERVTSKGGTTYAALTALNEAGVNTAFIAALKAAQDRARELGDEFGR